jgi:hypothetical protein
MLCSYAPRIIRSTMAPSGGRSVQIIAGSPPGPSGTSSRAIRELLPGERRYRIEANQILDSAV